MSNKAPVVNGPINHVKIVILALLASVAIMMVGFTARATDDTRGYGLVQIGTSALGSSHSVH